jgi:hypothetical protein
MDQLSARGNDCLVLPVQLDQEIIGKLLQTATKLSSRKGAAAGSGCLVSEAKEGCERRPRRGQLAEPRLDVLSRLAATHG